MPANQILSANRLRSAFLCKGISAANLLSFLALENVFAVLLGIASVLCIMFRTVKEQHHYGGGNHQ